MRESNKIRRKAPVVAITGQIAQQDVVRDEDYAAAADAQAHAWLAERRAQRIVAELAERLRHGAIDAGKEYYLDRELMMVRSRKKKRKAGNE